MIGLLAALLRALVLTGTFSHDGELTLDARAAGLACAGAAVLMRAPLLLIVLVAAAATAIRERSAPRHARPAPRATMPLGFVGAQ